MNITKKITVVFAVMMVAAMAAPAVMGADVGYSVSVLTGQNTAICAGPDGAFGGILPGNSGIITSSFGLSNAGDCDATVEAAFDTQSADPDAVNDFGLIGSTDADDGVEGTTANAVYISGDNFALEAVDLIGTKTYLTNDGSTVVIPNAVPHDSICYDYDAHLDVPGAAVPDSYSGNVELTFVNA